MRLGYLFIILLSVSLLSACKNRFEEYEPYSAFDDRMAEASRPSGRVPDDQMPPGLEDTYADYESNNAGATDMSPVDTAETKRAARAAAVAGAADVEVPFDEGRGQRHPANIGAM